MGVVLLDSTAVVGFLNRLDPFHDAASEAVRKLIKTEQLLVSAVTYAEVLTGAALNHHDLSQVEGFFDDLITDIAPVTRDVAREAACVRATRKSLRMPDALILATATCYPADRLITADSLWRKLSSPGVSIQTLKPAKTPSPGHSQGN